jgi:hypothetical protein
VTENSTTFEIGLLVPGLIAPLDPKAGIGATMPPAGAGNVRCPAHFRPSANNRYPHEEDRHVFSDGPPLDPYAPFKIGPLKGGKR